MEGESGFTLIELLVVIAIISLLVSILMPSLQLAKEMAKDVVCRSNQKNVCYALMLYAEDYDEMIPYISSYPAYAPYLSWACKIGKIPEEQLPWEFSRPQPDPRSPAHRWYEIALEGYVEYKHESEREGTFKCPAFIEQVHPKAGWNGAVSCQFSINGNLSRDFAEDRGQDGTCTRLSDIRRSSVLIGDGNLNPGGGVRVVYRFRTTGEYNGGGDLMVMNVSVSRDDPPGGCFGPWPQQIYISKWQLDWPCDFPGHPGGNSNLLLTDGRVESVNVIDITDWRIR